MAAGANRVISTVYGVELTLLRGTGSPAAMSLSMMLAIAHVMCPGVQYSSYINAVHFNFSLCAPINTLLWL